MEWTQIFTWNKTARELLVEEKKKKEVKIKPGFHEEFRNYELGDIITILIAGGKIKINNRNTGCGRYIQEVMYKGYSFLCRTKKPLDMGFLDEYFPQKTSLI